MSYKIVITKVSLITIFICHKSMIKKFLIVQTCINKRPMSLIVYMRNISYEEAKNNTKASCLKVFISWPFNNHNSPSANWRMICVKFGLNIFNFVLLLSPFGQDVAPHLNKFEFPLIKKGFWPSSIEIGPAVLEKHFF